MRDCPHTSPFSTSMWKSNSGRVMETETDDNLEPVSVGRAVHWNSLRVWLMAFFTAAFTSREIEYIYRGPDMFYMLSSKESQGVICNAAISTEQWCTHCSHVETDWRWCETQTGPEILRLWFKIKYNMNRKNTVQCRFVFLSVFKWWYSNIFLVVGIKYLRIILLYCYLVQHSHTHTHTKGRPGFLCDQQTRELNLWPLPRAWGPRRLQYHRADPIQPAWLGLARALSAHPLPQLARNTQHSLYRSAELMLWCSIKTQRSKFHSEDDPRIRKLHSRFKNCFDSDDV